MTYEEVSTIIGENLKKFRAAIHLSQLATATGIGMAEAHYRSLEHGESNPELKDFVQGLLVFRHRAKGSS